MFEEAGWWEEGRQRHQVWHKLSVTECLSNPTLIFDAINSHIMPTQGFNIKSLSQDGFKLNVWDIGGQKAIRPYWRNYYDNTDALVRQILHSSIAILSRTFPLFCFSFASFSTTDLGDWLGGSQACGGDSGGIDRAHGWGEAGWRAAARVRQQARFDHCFATKGGESVWKLLWFLTFDLHVFIVQSWFITGAQLAETLGLHTLRGRPWQIQACSAKTGEGLKEGLEWVLSNLKKQ